MLDALNTQGVYVEDVISATCERFEASAIGPTKQVSCSDEKLIHSG